MTDNIPSAANTWSESENPNKDVRINQYQTKLVSWLPFKMEPFL